MRIAFAVAPLPCRAGVARIANCPTLQQRRHTVRRFSLVRSCANEETTNAQTVSKTEKAISTPPNGEDISTRAARGVWRVGWIAWWVQLVLTTVSVVILLFAFAFPGVTVKSTASAPGLILAALASAASLVSWIWTYVYTRVALRVSKPLSRLARPLHVGVFLALTGTALAAFALQATVGTLLARVFTAAAGVQTGVQAGVVVQASAVQPIDLLVVQATVNALCSLFAGLLATLWLQGRLRVWQKEEAVWKPASD